MAQDSAADHDQDRAQEDMDPATADPSESLEEEIEVLKDQIAVLEEGLPQAPGAQKTALAKEIKEYHARLEVKRSALRLYRSARGYA